LYRSYFWVIHGKWGIIRIVIIAISVAGATAVSIRAMVIAIVIIINIPPAPVANTPTYSAIFLCGLGISHFGVIFFFFFIFLHYPYRTIIYIIGRLAAFISGAATAESRYSQC
jgi:hypothetical protein